MDKVSLHIRIDRRTKERFDSLLADSSGDVPYATRSRVVEGLIREWCNWKEEEKQGKG